MRRIHTRSDNNPSHVLSCGILTGAASGLISPRSTLLGNAIQIVIWSVCDVIGDDFEVTRGSRATE
jgi:hypothetical protein